jgi:hypothetical protein
MSLPDGLFDAEMVFAGTGFAEPPVVETALARLAVAETLMREPCLSKAIRNGAGRA